jgi:hypothetical protein
MPNTIRVIRECWNVAETELRSIIEKKYHDLDEECITKLFYSEFCFLLRDASQNKKVERAFLADLQKAFPEALCSRLSGFSANLIADVSLHKREMEKITGGDFGLTITRPQISRRSQSELILGNDYCRGLLCQAKIKRRNGKWGLLKKNQKEILPKHTDYLSLLLYSYSDAERCHLNPFEWQLCRNISMDNMEHWLKTGGFSSLLDSSQIIGQLGNDLIGTGHQETIEKIIRPEGKPHLNIRISWPPDKRPPNSVHIFASHKIEQQVKVRS